MRYRIGVDLGGTNIAVGVVDEEYRILGRGKIKTRAPRPAEEIAADMASACRMALSEAGLTEADVEWIGVGSPGIIDPVAGLVEFSNNLDFHHVPLRRLFSEATGKPVFLENDANVAAFGEALAGGARGFSDVVALTLGTGVGGGIIIGGKIYAGSNHAGAELGHVGMVYGGLPCSCGHSGCVEMYCSVKALIRQTREKMRARPDSAMWQMCGGDIEQVGGRLAFQAQRAGDEAAGEVVRQYIDYLGYAVTNFISIFQPQIVLIGGGISHEGEPLLGPVRAYVRAHRLFENAATRVEAATLSNDAGIIGAAFLGI